MQALSAKLLTSFITDLRELLIQSYFVIYCNTNKFVWFTLKNEILMGELANELILSFYDPNKKCILVNDACYESMGGILLGILFLGNGKTEEKPFACMVHLLQLGIWDSI